LVIILAGLRKTGTAFRQFPEQHLPGISFLQLISNGGKNTLIIPEHFAVHASPQSLIAHKTPVNLLRNPTSFCHRKQPAIKISRSSLASLKRDEMGITVNGNHVTVRYVLKENDVLFINDKDSASDLNESILPVNIPINILLENDEIILVDKPPYMPTHPSHGHIDDTLANAIAYIFQARKLPFVFRPIGRLDRNTSGISLIAKNSISASYLFHARQHSLIKKKYIAILCGKIESDGGTHTIDTYMKRQEESIIVRCVGNADDEGAFIAITHWRLLYSNESISIVEAIPITGRTHQLRVHFAHIGHPLLGDDVYGEPSEHIGRHALHAAYLSIPMPYSGEETAFVSPPPADMADAALKLGNVDLLRLCLDELTNNKENYDI
jgi:23S rRNA pseudouridine1911/1915/1917 synthase